MDTSAPILTPPAPPPFSTSTTPPLTSQNTDTPPPSSPPPPPDTPLAPPPSPPSPQLDIPNAPPPAAPTVTPNVPPPSPPPPIDTPSVPPPSLPLDSLSSPPPPSPPPPTSNPPPSPEVFSPPPPPDIASSPPNPSENPPKSPSPEKSPSKNYSSPPPAVSPPSHDQMAPPHNATSPSSTMHFSPPAPLNSSPVTDKASTISATHTPLSNVASSSGGGMKPGSATGIGILVGLVALTLLVLAVWFKKKRNRSRDGSYAKYVLPSIASSQNSGSLFLKPQDSAYIPGIPSRTNSMYSPDSGVLGNSRSCFTYEELVEATKGFSKQNILGEGGFGCVYKGVLVDGREVAVKQLKAGSGQGEREFQAEVEIISRVHHRHLVSLVGYCISEQQRLLVYDFVQNDTLDYHLHSESTPAMGWETRVRVAAGAARGIAYLHEDCHPRIIHRDIKSSNILIDSNFEAQVADFGLAKLAMDTNTHVSTRVMGTFGYLAPEYAQSGKVTEKSDVFSFGVVLLELITGRKPVDASQPYGDESLVEWARPLLTEALERDDFDELVDPRLGNNYDSTEVFRMIEAAASCIRHSALKRPRMSQVVRALDSMDEISGLSNGAKVGDSVIIDSREQSAQIRMFQKTAFGSQEYSTGFPDRSRSGWKS